jgi:hypothetical protein
LSAALAVELPRVNAALRREKVEPLDPKAKPAASATKPGTP